MRRFTGTEYLKIGIANAFGLDRLTWDQRLDWHQSNQDQLADLAVQAKEPYSFAKLWMALERAKRGEAIGTPVILDATQSGIQLMAVLSGCRKTAEACNVIYTGNREDAYAAVADKMGKTRDVIKRPLMTHYYGSEENPKRAFGEELPQFYAALEGAMPGAERIRTALLDLWDNTALEYSWHLPDGFTVKAKVFGMTDKKVEVDELDHATFTYRMLENKPQKKGKMLVAHLVHSVDAFVCREMIRRLHKQKIQVLPIHDAFGAHPNYLNQVRETYVQILSDIAASNLLQEIMEEMTESKQPSLKDEDLSKDVLNAEYALS